LGEFRVAQARAGNTGNIVYEVVYSEVQDSGVNERGESPPQSVPTAFPIPNPDGPGTIDQVYPNSLIEMRDQVIDTVGQYAQVLPLWMTSKQENGRVLGFTRAVIVAYCLPGRGEQLAYNIRTQWGERLNLVDFTADRYILDRQYSKNWDPVTESWIPSPAQATTFDRDSGDETIFDGRGTVFITPEDNYGLTDQYNKYLLYPKYNILEGPPEPPPPPPVTLS
jgi:hypothetical protein